MPNSSNDSGSSALILGFIGDQEIHRDNARALLEDLISAHRRNNKSAPVTFVIAVEPFTTTLDELADYCLTSNYKLELYGHSETLSIKAVKNYHRDAKDIHALASNVSVATGIITRISEGENPRLITIADPNEDDEVYLAVETAIGKGIKVRSLLNGLDEVLLESDEEETGNMSPRGRDVEEDEDELEEEDDEDLEEDEEEDEDEDEEEDVIGDDEDEETEDDEDEDLEDEEDDADDEDEEDLEDDDEEEEEEPAPRKRPAKKAAAKKAPAKKAAAKSKPAADPLNGKKPTAANLTRLAERDKDAFYALVAEEDIRPGRGIKIPRMVNDYLVAVGAIEPSAPVVPAKKAPAVRKAVAKKTSSAPKETTLVASSGVADVLEALGNALLEAAAKLG